MSEMPTNRDAILLYDIDHKIDLSKTIIHKALDKTKIEEIAIAITGGKDSTVNLWLFKQVCDEMKIKLPVCMFIDEGDVFSEIREFIDYIEKLWSLDICYLKNEDVSSKVTTIGDIVKISSLNAFNQNSLKEMDFFEAEFPFIPDSSICNHLMKTLPMKEFIMKNNIKILSTAIRWDEQDARVNEIHLSPRKNPDHMRLHPVLHFKERDIWVAIFKYDIPFNSLYKLGYRSLGARNSTSRASDIPAWLQDLEHTPERMGRGQEKEAVMHHLRALGYM